MPTRPVWIASLALTLVFAPITARAGGPIVPPPPAGSLDARVFDVLNRAASGDAEFNQRRQELFSAATPQEQDSLLRAAAPDEVPAAGTNASTAPVFVFQNLRDRLYALREGEAPMWANRSGFGLAMSGAAFDVVPGAGGDDLSRLGLFLNGIGSFGNADRSNEEVGYDFHGAGLSAGLDYRFAPKFVAGAAFGWLTRESDFDASGGKMEQDEYSGSLYASYLGEQLSVDAIVTYSRIPYDIDRRVAFSSGGSTVSALARSRPDGDEIAASGGVGYEFEPAALGGLTFGPQLQLNYVYWQLERFTESGGAGLALRYRRQHLDSLQSIAGGDASFPISTGLGVITPQVRAGWVHEFQADRRRITASFVNDTNGGQFFVRTNQPDRDWATLAGSVSLAFAGGWSTFVDYETVLGLSGFEEHTFTAGARLEF